MNNIIILLVFFFFVFVSYKNIKFWIKEILKGKGDEFWWLPWLMIPLWIGVNIFAIYIYFGENYGR